MSGIYGLKTASGFKVAENIEGSVRNLDTVAKYAQCWFGVFELPGMGGLSTPVKNLNKIMKGFIEWNKGTYGALSRFDEWLPDAKGHLYWQREKNKVNEIATQVLMTVVSCFDVVGLFQTITGGAKLGVAAKAVQSGAFFGGMSFTVASLLDPLSKAYKNKKIIEDKLAKWKRKDQEFRSGFRSGTLKGDAIQALKERKIAQYKVENEALENAQRKVTDLKANQLSSTSDLIKINPDELKQAEDALKEIQNKSLKGLRYQEGHSQLLIDHGQAKIQMWQRQLVIAKNDLRGKWFDIAKTVAKAVQLVFALAIMACGTVALSVLIADAVVKFAMGHFALASLLNKEFKPEALNLSYLPKDLTITQR
jgi:hypothetical protein